MAKSRILFNEQQTVINAELARIIGLNEAIIVAKIAELIQTRNEDWIYKSINDWQASEFPYWSIDTVQRTFKKLEKSGIVIAANRNTDKFDKTLSYTIDFEKLSHELKGDV